MGRHTPTHHKVVFPKKRLSKCLTKQLGSQMGFLTSLLDRRPSRVLVVAVSVNATTTVSARLKPLKAIEY